MTSANFTMYPARSIQFDDSIRQRTELQGIEELMESIKNVGLINPPLITRDGQLIAGRRRLEACLRLEWPEVPVQFADEVDPDRLHLIELEENVKRVDLTWQEVNKAVVDYHNIRRREDPEWTQEDTAHHLAFDRSIVGKHLIINEADRVAPELKVYEADTFSTARGLAARALERRSANALESLVGGSAPSPIQPPTPTTLDGTAIQPVVGSVGEIINTNFREWTKTNTEKFNFIHCDFPYGVDTGSKTSGQSGTKRLGHYDDSESVYWDLLEFLCDNTKRLCEPQAHLMFWFSMKFYHETKRALEQAGWKIDPFPLIWHKTDNSGIIPDSNRGGRRGYEVCLFGSRGDRKIVRPLSNIFGASNPRENHAHEKPQDMLRHFMTMIVDGSTTMLDPTCGSGSAVKAAAAVGAKRALGLELDLEFAERARRFVNA